LKFGWDEYFLVQRRSSESIIPILKMSIALL
jgi:hypothetical protein